MVPAKPHRSLYEPGDHVPPPRLRGALELVLLTILAAIAAAAVIRAGVEILG